MWPPGGIEWLNAQSPVQTRSPAILFSRRDDRSKRKKNTDALTPLTQHCLFTILHSLVNIKLCVFPVKEHLRYTLILRKHR